MTRDDETAALTHGSTAQLLTHRLRGALSDAGYRVRLAPIHLVAKVRETILDLREQGLVREELALTYGVGREFSPPPEVPEPRTLIVVASPSFPVRVRFQLDSGPFEAVVPPTYISAAREEQALSIVRGVLEPEGFSAAQVRVPDKLLAVRSGLAQYGRNNVAYVSGMGSFARLDVFCTDADLKAEEYHTKASELMSCCPPCRNCHHHCPTGCIPYDGTVIDATRCLTYINEQEGEWPEWLNPRAHNSLVGCMRCQEMCPANRYYLRKQPVVAEFDEAETSVILENRLPEQLPEFVRAKLQALDLDGYSPVLGRNLLALVKARE
jgi:epoxyqueuosine reductase